MRWSFRNRPIILLTEYTLEIILEIQHSIRNHSKCFWVIDWVTMLLLTINESWDDFLILRKKRTSWGCLLGSWLKLIFHWKVQLFILFKSSFKFFADKSLSNTRERDVSTAKSLGFETKFSDKSFKYIEKSSGRRIEPWGTPASRLIRVEFWPFRTTLCFLSFIKFAKVFSKLPATPFCFNL